ncbi:PQQ-binding-like beta-propeller repeat protein [Streptomyces sp. NPDC018352]|uniref:protein kinase domain-containing protein n=1 Tax=Streptomyces sp. NPDC018352 TaxID=3157194 RepID=UPI00340D8215
MKEFTDQDPRVLGGFRLLARLGEGGMGRVYLAVDGQGERVAVKVVHPEYATDQEFRRRFRREARLAARVAGPGLARVVAADPDAEPPWLVTEYVPGLALSEAVDAHGALPAPACRRLAGQLIEALKTVHAAGLVHRDLKPNNVILAADGAHLIDFGIARSADESAITHTGQTPGTPGYIAPEVLLGKTADARADVFALGAVLAFAAQARHPYGTGPAAVVMARPLATDPDLSGITEPELKGVVQRCLAQDPAHRPGLAEIAGITEARPAATGFWIPATMLDGIGRRAEEAAELTRMRPARSPSPHPPTALPAPQPPTVTTPARKPRKPSTATSTPRPAPSRKLRLPHGSAAFTRRGALGLAALATGAWVIGRMKGLGGEDPGPRPRALWHHAMKGEVATPVVADGVVYAGSSKRGITALDARTGRQRWHVPLRTGAAWLTHAEGTLYFSDSGEPGINDVPLHAIDARTGRARWTVSGPHPGYEAVTAHRDLVYLSHMDPLRALDSSNGKVRWAYRHDPDYQDSLSVTPYGDVLYVTGKQGVDCLDAASGRRRWRTDIQMPRDIAVSGGALYVAGFGAVSVLDRRTGKLRRSYGFGSNWPFDVVASGRTLCVTDNDDVVGVDVATGEKPWRIDMRNFPDLSAMEGGLVAVGDGDQICLIEAASGTVRWRLAPDTAVSYPVLTDSVVYVGVDDDGVMALDTAKPPEPSS